MKKVFRGDRFTAEFEDKNGYFSLTGTTEQGMGAVGDEIVKIDPRFDLVNKLHLCSCKTGLPMYAIENGLYFINEGKIETVTNHFRVSKEKAVELMAKVAQAGVLGRNAGVKDMNKELERVESIRRDIKTVFDDKTVFNIATGLIRINNSLRAPEEKVEIPFIDTRSATYQHCQDIKRNMLINLEKAEEEYKRLPDRTAKAYQRQAVETFITENKSRYAAEAKQVYRIIKELPSYLIKHDDEEPFDFSRCDEPGRVYALSKFLDCNPNDIEEEDTYRFTAYGKSYLVLTDYEADEHVKEYIQESAWAFTPEFLSSFTGMPAEMFSAVQDKCEGANDAILTCIERSDGGLDEFVNQAIAADGRGRFLNRYNGHEDSVTIDAGYPDEEGQEYFIYRE